MKLAQRLLSNLIFLQVSVHAECSSLFVCQSHHWQYKGHFLLQSPDILHQCRAEGLILDHSMNTAWATTFRQLNKLKWFKCLCGLSVNSCEFFQPPLDNSIFHPPKKRNHLMTVAKCRVKSYYFWCTPYFTVYNFYYYLRLICNNNDSYNSLKQHENMPFCTPHLGYQIILHNYTDCKFLC